MQNSSRMYLSWQSLQLIYYLCYCYFAHLITAICSCVILTIAHWAPLSTGFSRQEYWTELPCPPQGIFLTQRSNLGLLHCRQILYHLRHQGKFVPLRSLITETCSRANIVGWLRSQNAKNGFSYIKKVMPGTLSLDFIPVHVITVH